MDLKINDIREAVARGWCHKQTEKKEFDGVLAEEISQEVFYLFVADRNPYLGCATTRQLIEELQARAEVSETIGESWPKYRTVGA